MKRILMLSLILAITGCQGLRPCEDPCASGDGVRKRMHGGLLKHLHHDCESKTCKPEDLKGPAPVKAAPPARQEVEEAPQRAAPVIAQDVLLVPKTVYIPYAAQTPVAPMRLSSPLVGQPPERPAPITGQPPEKPAPITGQPTPQKAQPKEVPCEVTTQILDICRKLNDRLDCLERKHNVPQQAAPCPPTIVPCPPIRSIFPLFRRPLVPQCETMQHCEPGATPGGTTRVPMVTPMPEGSVPAAPPGGTTRVPMVTPMPEGSVPAAPERIMTMPRHIEISPIP